MREWCGVVAFGSNCPRLRQQLYWCVDEMFSCLLLPPGFLGNMLRLSTPVLGYGFASEEAIWITFRWRMPLKDEKIFNRPWRCRRARAMEAAA